MFNLGLGYLSLERSTPTFRPANCSAAPGNTSPLKSFGVVYVLDEPSAGLHPADTEALLDALESLKQSGNSLFVVEHELDVIRRADWLVDVGPSAGEKGGQVLYSGPPVGLRSCRSITNTTPSLSWGPNVSKKIPRTAERLAQAPRCNAQQLTRT